MLVAVTIFVLLLAYCRQVNSTSCLEIKQDGPVVLGGSIIFSINYTCDPTLTNTRFHLIDHFHKTDQQIVKNSSSMSTEIKFDDEVSDPGTYRLSVEFYRQELFFWLFVDRNEIEFEIEPRLSLALERKPNDGDSQHFIRDRFVPRNVSFQHRISIVSEANRRLVSNTSRVFWFIDCNRTANSSGFLFNQSFPQLDHEYKMDAIVAVERPQNHSLRTPNITVCGSQQFLTNASFVYGHYEWTAIPKDPISNTSVIGNSWLPQGNPLELNFYCNGSNPFRYCVRYYGQLQNRSFENVTCFYEQRSDNCSIPITWYYYYPGKFTVLAIVDNSVSAIKYNITVNVYEITKQMQLSVIIVPMFFILISIVMVIFGIAYFLQKRRESIIEEANFDFAQRDLSYQSFCERLTTEMEAAMPHWLKKLTGRFYNRTCTSETASVSASGQLATSDVDSTNNLFTSAD